MNHGRAFDEILARVRRDNMARLWARATLANRVAKIAREGSRALTYLIKDEAMNRLVHFGACRVLHHQSRGSVLQFMRAARLHFRPSFVEGPRINKFHDAVSSQSDVWSILFDFRKEIGYGRGCSAS